jgi:hypothetical protein
MEHRKKLMNLQIMLVKRGEMSLEHLGTSMEHQQSM